MGYFNSHHVNSESFDSGQLKCFNQRLLYRLEVNDWHLQLSVKDHHTHQICSEHDDGEGIQWGHIIYIRIWKCSVDLSTTRCKDGNKHALRSGASAGVIQSYLTVSDHGQRQQSRTGASLWSQPRQWACHVVCHSTSGLWAILLGLSTRIDWLNQYRQPKPGGTEADWVGILAPCRQADNMAPPLGRGWS